MKYNPISTITFIWFGWILSVLVGIYIKGLNPNHSIIACAGLGAGLVFMPCLFVFGFMMKECGGKND
jgi:hypothetical protein